MKDGLKSAFVTGASSGIGYSTAIELASKGYKVFAGARRLEAMEPLKSHGITILRLDVTSMESIIASKNLIEQQTDGSLDILFNNAGVPCRAPAFDLEEEWFRFCFEVNVFGPMRTVKVFHPLLIKSKGLIAFTGSTAGLVPLPFNTVYSSSKGAIQSYANSLALEVQPFGIKVLNFVAGAVETDIGANDAHDIPETSVFMIDGENLFDNGKVLKNLKQMPSDTFAKKAVADIEKCLSSSHKNFWMSYRGKSASLVYLLVSYFPRSFLTYIIIKSLKLKDAFKKIKQKYA
mmetsp:Transcript_5234/g.5220  ORF Transcript_5234/g.5220 Transcript_5234/m.5220 type:complete len:290 (-) Transcript_5234:394-1263(-)